MNTYLFEPDRNHIKIIEEICTAYSVKHNTEINLKAKADVPKCILCSDGYSHEMSVYMIRGHENSGRLAVSICRINSANYLVLVADGLGDVISYISAQFRPSGVLLRPAEYCAAEKIFDDIYADSMRDSNTRNGQFRFKIRSCEYCINFDSILYFEAANKKMVLRTAGQAFEFYMSAEDVMKQLPHEFVRIHKSYIVNTAHITLADYKSMTAVLDDGSKIFISRTYKSGLQSVMSEGGGNV